MKIRIIALTMGLGLSQIACTADDGKPAKDDKPVMETSEEKPQEPENKVVKTDEEWRKQLTPEQYRILRKAGTEAPNGKVYKEFKEQGQGTYHCAGCGALPAFPTRTPDPRGNPATSHPRLARERLRCLPEAGRW